jgi:hypothetical protein
MRNGSSYAEIPTLPWMYDILVDRQHHGVLRRLHIHPDKVCRLPGEAGSVLMHQRRRGASEIWWRRSTRQIWCLEMLPRARANSVPSQPAYPMVAVIQIRTPAARRRPLAAASLRSAGPWCANRPRHLLTVAARVPNSLARLVTQPLGQCQHRLRSQHHAPLSLAGQPRPRLARSGSDITMSAALIPAA